ncbi:hypothetical protein [Tatumella sp. OPLPL6]|uniref:hypothetical protein n=1 Tax=Tatumella sp. OPLPL6 TaxID=1928657 RepID=UPI000C18EF86|nr:hypothetical protein [Tatumella sp. OPLPL6]PIJ40560.1 hypothetical protein BOM24_15620 [Tatumella sp. OPLPL6]
MLEPLKGKLTFRAEGNNIKGNHGYSRVIHWPGSAKLCTSTKSKSGVTIGRGYDMSNRTSQVIINDLRNAGIDIEQAKKISLAAGKHNCDALYFVSKYRDEIGEISEEQQLKLFKITYPYYVNDSVRFYKKYCSSDALEWNKLSSKIRDVFVDMKYQGAIRNSDVKHFERNDIDEIVAFISSSPHLLSFENRRGRIKYLRRGL